MLCSSFVSAAAVVTNVQLMDTFTLTLNIRTTDIDGNSITRITTGTLIITDNTVSTLGIISNGTLALEGYTTMTVTGYVGKGSRPTLVLYGTSADCKATFFGKVKATAGVVSTITGSLNGFGYHSVGTLGDDPAGAVASWSTVAQYDGTTSALLTQAAVEGSTYVQFTPPRGFKLSQLDTIVSGWSLAHKLQVSTSNGPQVELKFQKRGTSTPDGIAHVDITLLPYQQTGTGNWVVSSILSASTTCGYYGNDPVDGTAFSEFSGTILLEDVEAAINAEVNMGTDSASAWELTRVRIELWEAGARTCYIDDVVINGRTYTFEPVSFSGSVKGLP
jgi:hypothetical protein